ncbi:MAG: right-handed parallel beta-helix repeat-containing protein [Candidatus Marinimicrobia bacterium]|nr:right-handed parallel beta-helix repeat-containing protein [Candidatus Neomarinimicrobiota bacterium]
MKNVHIPIHSLIKIIRIVPVLISMLVLVSCSQGIRIKNLVNYPIQLSGLDALDTLKISPDIVKYSGTEVSSFRKMMQDIRIQGRHEARPVWSGDKQGCFLVDQGAGVYISDFNFQGTTADTALIRVKSGYLILENCDFLSSDFWAIQVDSGAILELRNVKFTTGGEGAVHLRGGQAKIFDSHFEQVGNTAVYASGGDLFEIHSSVLRNTMGSALNLNLVNEVWLDSVRIIDSFQDGIAINGCDYVLINEVGSRENGRHGLVVNDAKILGLLNFSSMGNLVNGMELNAVDTLRILNSEFIGNGQSGGVISNTQRTRIAGIRVGHNGGEGFQFNQGNELWINNSSFQANPLTGLGIDSLTFIDLKQVSLVNNGQGLFANTFDSLGIDHSLFNSNRTNAMDIRRGDQLHASQNLVKGNSSGLVIKEILFVSLDSNRVESNILGNDIQSVPTLKMNDNVWVSNESGAYFSDIGSMSSTSDQWLSNLDTGFEIFSADELVISGARIHNNRNGALFNEVSLRIESTSIDSSREIGLKFMHSIGILEKISSQHNGVAVELGEGSQANITQSQFKNNELNINAGASVSLNLSFSTVSHSRNGVRLGNYAEASILSNQFKLIDSYSVELSGPHIQALLMRQNVISKTGGILNSRASSGDIQLQSNTFANNISGITAPKRTMTALDHNIFFHTVIPDHQILRDEQLFKWNCLYPPEEIEQPSSTESLNIYSDPGFGPNYYLNPISPCINGGDNGLLIGALGALPIARPALQP